MRAGPLETLSYVPEAPEDWMSFSITIIIGDIIIGDTHLFSFLFINDCKINRGRRHVLTDVHT